VAKDNSIGIMANGSVVDSCNATANRDMGFYASDSCMIRNSIAFNNVNAGIFVQSYSAVIGNLCRSNMNPDEDGVGIVVGGSETRVEGNSVVANDIGIWVTEGSKNVIIRNNASSNPGGNYNISAGNDVGPIGTAAASTSPWANIAN